MGYLGLSTQRWRAARRTKEDIFRSPRTRRSIASGLSGAAGVAAGAEPSGTHMRCQFRLVHPSDGMNGGGLGQCQLPDGTTIDANFPKG
jgi:hypothetical protein